MMALRGLEEVPRELQRAVTRRMSQEADASDNAPSADAESEDGASSDDVVRESKLEAEARASLERSFTDLESHRSASQEAEQRLASLMRDYDAAIERIEEGHRRQRELQCELTTGEALVAANDAAADLSRKRAEEAERALQVAMSIRKAADDASASSEPAVTCIANSALNACDDVKSSGVEATRLRQELEALARNSEALVKENASLEVRLRRCRATAVADLERAVPLKATSFWRGVDGPTMKAVTLLARSSCVRKAFGIHLLATYAWLFLLIFWLEHNHHAAMSSVAH